jgi:hypothetical protein
LSFHSHNFINEDLKIGYINAFISHDMTTIIETGDRLPGPQPEETIEIGFSNLALNDNDNTAEPSVPSTLFPKITGKVEDLIERFNYIYPRPSLPGTPTTISFSGTVKLHGTHSDLVIYSNDTIRIQSRNRLSLDTTHDNYGVAASILPLRAETLELRNKFRERFLELNPGTQIKDEYPLIIAGEWIGPGVQKNVAIEKLPSKYFVILSISINTAWIPNEGYEDISNESVGIYNISRGGTFSEIMDVDDPKSFIHRATMVTLEVEKECPFAKSFGLSGVGEGIVWKAAHPLGSDSRFWFKTKGPLHRITNTDALKKSVAIRGSNKTKAKSFAEAAVTVQRLEQAWDYLGEMEIKRNKAGLSEFNRWLNNDVEVEEKKAIADLDVNKHTLRKEIQWIGKAYYFKRLEEN